MRHISKLTRNDIGDRTSARPFFGQSTISQHAFVWDAINLEPGPSALRWLLGDDDADRAWGRVKITSHWQLIGYFEGKAVLPRIDFRTAGGHRAVAKLSLSRAGLKFKSFCQTVASCQHVQHARPASTAVRSLRRPKHARRSDKRSMWLMPKASKYRGTDPCS